jgi:general secretion pathway protein G
MKKHLQTPMGGFTLLELMITVAIVGILASIATPNYIKFRDQARAEMALTGIRLIEKEIAQYLITYGELPKDLSLIGMDHVLDPWGRPYEYLVTQGICDEKVKDNKNKKGKKDDKGKNESYLAGFRRIFLEPAFLFSGFNIAFIQLVEFNKIFPQDIILSLLAKKDEDDKDKKGKDTKDDKDKKDKDDKSEKGKPRKDHQMHPINCDYDLYSVGKDGKSTAPLTAKVSQDDIIRANNGGYVGLVSNY